MHAELLAMRLISLYRGSGHDFQEQVKGYITEVLKLPLIQVYVAWYKLHLHQYLHVPLMPSRHKECGQTNEEDCPGCKKEGVKWFMDLSRKSEYSPRLLIGVHEHDCINLFLMFYSEKHPGIFVLGNKKTAVAQRKTFRSEC